MSGHSHWATIKRAKGAADAKKGKIFSKLGKEITIVVKAKGGDPNTNPTLRTLIAKAKAAQMPNDNIDRAIKKGTGELESAALVDATYEGIKGGIAIVVTVLTDNKNRAAAEVGNVFKKNGTELAKQGSAARLFVLKGDDLAAIRRTVLGFIGEGFPVRIRGDGPDGLKVATLNPRGLRKKLESVFGAADEKGGVMVLAPGRGDARGEK